MRVLAKLTWSPLVAWPLGVLALVPTFAPGRHDVGALVWVAFWAGVLGLVVGLGSRWELLRVRNPAAARLVALSFAWGLTGAWALGRLLDRDR